MILDKTFPPDPRVENEAVSLIENGFEVYLFCLKYDKSELKFEITKGIKIKKYLSNKLVYKLSALAYTFPFYSNNMYKKISNFLIKNQIDAIHIHDIRIAEAAFKANRNLKLPTVLDLHENRPEIMRFYPHLKKFPGNYLISINKWKKKEEEFIKNANKIIVVTEESKNEIINRTGKPHEEIVVVPNTVRKNYSEKAIIQGEIVEKYKNYFVLLYVGDTGLRRGLKTSIEAIHTLKDKIENVKLVIVGSSTSDAYLKREVEKWKVEKFVDFEGWKDENLLPSYFVASDICISPLYRNVHHDTTYANKLSQYMSFAKPVLVSNATAQKNLIESVKSGLVHEERNVVDFTQKVLELYTNQSLSKELGANGKQFIEKEFCWEKTSEKLIELYNDLII